MSNHYLTNITIEKKIRTSMTDMLVIGSGVAGLFTAYCTAEFGRRVTILTKNLQESNTRYAQGGIAAVLDHLNDSYQEHINDTLLAGGELCDAEAVRILVEEGPPLVKKLMKLGAHFDREPDGDLMLTREGGHSHYRVLHSDGDQTGREIARALQEAVINHPLITIADNWFAIDLINDSNQCVGVVALDDEHELQRILAEATVIATGGLGQIYAHTTNPEVATADGMAMAYRAGVEMMNMALIQFHPTALALKGKPSFLVSEAVRGEGAVLRNQQHERFMLQRFPRAELEPRDVVAKAMVAEMDREGSDFISLDISPLFANGVDFAERFPYINMKLREYGIDPLSEDIPVAPAAHYAMGGIKTDLHGRTSLKSLYACGEAACSGLHGANRLASNSLLDGLVFSRRIALDYLDNAGKKATLVPVIHYNISRIDRIFDYQYVKKNIQNTMWKHVGLVRNEKSILQAINVLGNLEPYLWQNLTTKSEFEAANLLIVAKLICQSALWRKESRGSHFRSDYPQQRDKYQKADIIRR